MNPRRPQLDRHTLADTPQEHADRMERAQQIMKDPLGYWRKFCHEPRSLTGGPELSDVAPRPVRGYYQPQK